MAVGWAAGRLFTLYWLLAVLHSSVKEKALSDMVAHRLKNSSSPLCRSTGGGHELRQAQIGFSQRIRLEWFEQTANMILAGNDKTAINDSLQALLEDKVSVGGQAVRGGREKVITILLKTWLTVPRELEALRDEGLDIFQRLPRKERTVIHWGMVLGSLSVLGCNRR